MLGNVSNAFFPDVLTQLGVGMEQVEQFIREINDKGRVLIPQVPINIVGNKGSKLKVILVNFLKKFLCLLRGSYPHCELGPTSYLIHSLQLVCKECPFKGKGTHPTISRSPTTLLTFLSSFFSFAISFFCKTLQSFGLSKNPCQSAKLLNQKL